MSRNYANIMTAIWREDDWCRLSADAQRTFFLLFSQPDITAAGVLALTIGRWSAKANNTTPASIRADLAELESARYVVVDYDHEELLVRTFVKWDGGSGNPKRRPIILRAAHDVVSPILRVALVAEFVRLGLPVDDLVTSPPPPDRHPDSHSVPDVKAIDRPASQDRPNWDSPTRVMGYAQVNSLSDSHSDTHPDSQSASEGVVVTKGLYVVPQPTTLKPQTPPAALEPASPGSTPTQRSKRITDAYAAVQPMSKWPAVNAIVLRAIKADRWSDDEIHDAMQRLAADERGVTVETLRFELTGPPARRASSEYVERNGHRLKPETAMHLDDDQRWAELDAARSQQQPLAIEGTAS